MRKRLMVVIHLAVLLSLLTGSMAAGPVSASPDDPTATPRVAQDGDGDGMNSDGDETTSNEATPPPTLPRQRTLAAESEPDPDDPLAHRLRQARTDRVYGEPPDADPSEQDLYIVRLADDPLSTYEGGVENLAATSPQATGRSKLNATSTAARRYRRYLEGEQDDFIQQVEQKLNRPVEVIYRYQVAFNGVSLKLTPVEAEALLEMPGVLLVERSQEVVPTTSGTPEYLGLPAIWNHPDLPTKGEGIIIGVIDSGVWPEHPSFADDGTYPDPPARWQGECVQPADDTDGYTCNNKLIGMRYFLNGYIANVGGTYDGLFSSGRDDTGHGTHVAAIAAGNEGVLASTYGIDRGTVSGMAPRAHLASYKIFGPSLGTDLDILAAIDAAVSDGVDVINYSVGNPYRQDPWTSSQSLSFLNARAAGVFVAASAGNDGPNAATINDPASAPWVTAVGSSHDNHLYLSEVTVAVTDTTVYTLTGATPTGGVSDYRLVFPPDVPEIPGDEDWKCTAPFPAGTFESTDIVMCPNSASGSKHVQDGGAGAVLSYSSWYEYQFALYRLPSVVLLKDEGTAIKALLEDHPGDVTISFTQGERITDPDPRIPTNTVVAGSSRGPNTNGGEGLLINTLKPDLVAPGSHILAGTSPEQVDLIGGSVQPYAQQGELFKVTQGTSMSSPHVAGIAALLIAQHPDWTPAEVQSALLLTANDEHIMARTASGDVAATPFDMGAGIVRPTLAMTTGFVLDQSIEGYQYANPAWGGNPRWLNLPSMVDSTCVGQCTWYRTIRSTLDQSVDWTVSYSATSDLSLSVSPETFTLEPGASIDLEITADVSGANFGAWLSGSLRLAPGDPTVAPAHMPVVARSARGEFPRKQTVPMMRDVGYQDIVIPRVVGVSDLHIATSSGTPQKTILDVTQDTNLYPTDGMDGVGVTHVVVPPGAQILVSEIISTTAQYVNLYVGRDTNGDYMPQEKEALCFAMSGNPRRCIIQGEKLQPGLYWVLVHNLQGSGNATDQIAVANTVAMPGGDGMSVEGPSSVPDGDRLSLRLHWNIPGLERDEKRYGTIVLGSDASNPDNLATILVELVREEDDVLYYPLSSDSYEIREGVLVDPSSLLQSGGHLTYVIYIEPWNYDEDYTYILETTLPDALSYVEGSSSFPITVNGQTLRWEMHTDSYWYDDIESITYEVALTDQARFPSTLTPELHHNTDQDGTVEETAGTDPIELTGIALDISKTAPARVDQEGIYTYTLTVTNTGVVEATGLTVYDALPLAVQRHISGGTLSDDGLVKWPIETLAAGASTTVELSVQAPSSVPGFEEPDANAIRIIGGDNAEPGEWPYTVALVTASKPDAYQGQFCGGTLIQREWVLTAAHCIEETQPNDIDIVAGRQRLSSNEGERIPVTRIIAHPDYNIDVQTDYDMALLHLSRPVAEDVPLVRMLDSRLPLAAPATMASVVGWGNMSVEDPQYPDMLQEVEVPIVDQEVCRTAAWNYGGTIVTDRMICAGPQEGGQDSCQGDSGGPLLVSDGSDGHQQVGVVSFGYNSCAQPDGYGIYASVPDLKAWVIDTINTFSNHVVNDYYGVESDHGTSFARSSVPVRTKVENLPPDSITITGATTGTVGVRQSFTATVAPNDTTRPLEYTWSPEPDHGQGTPTATYDWFDPNASELRSGEQTVSVTVDNMEGSASDSFTVDVSPPVLTLESNLEEPAPSAPVYFTASVAPTSPHYKLVHFLPGDGHDPIVMKLKRSTGTWTTPYTYTEAGDYTAKAVLLVGDNDLELASDTLALTIAIDEPETLHLTASDTSIAADGVSTTTLTAQATDIYLNRVPGLTVNFSTTAGVLSSNNAATDNDGLARVTLTAADEPTTATVRAWMGKAATTSISNSIAIAFTPVDTGPTTETIPLERVTIDGPHHGSTSITHTFTAIVSPTNATGPIAYTWSPEPVSGQGTAQAHYTFDTSGPSTLLVQATAQSKTVEAERTFYVNQSDIGAAGGTLEVFNANGETIFRLEIPAGVLTEEHSFRFTERSAPAHPIGEGFTFTGRAFALDAFRGGSRLDSLAFGSPVGVQVTFDLAGVKDTGKLHLKRYDPGTQSWIDAAVGETTVTENNLRTTIDHLTEYAVFEATEPSIAIDDTTVYLPVVQR